MKVETKSEHLDVKFMTVVLIVFPLTHLPFLIPELPINTTDDKFNKRHIALVRQGVSFEWFLVRIASKESAFSAQNGAKNFLQISERNDATIPKRNKKSFDSLQSEKDNRKALLQRGECKSSGKRKSNFKDWLENACFSLGDLVAKIFLGNSFWNYAFERRAD